MSDTFVAAVTVRNLDSEDDPVDKDLTSSFKLTLPSPVVRDNSSSTIQVFNNIVIPPPPPPSPCEWIDKVNLNNNYPEVDNSRRCIIL